MSGILKAIQQQGGPTKLGAALGVSKAVINGWRVRNQVPAPFCPEIEKLTCGTVLCEELNDTIDWAYIRNSRPSGRRKTDRKTE